MKDKFINSVMLILAILFLVAIVIIDVASASFDTQNCTSCHPSLNFQVPSVNLVNCSRCHDVPLNYHQWIPGWTIYQTQFGWYRAGTNPEWYLDSQNNSSIHMTGHPGTYAKNNDLNSYCALRCHLTADCSSCHVEVPHISHGNLSLPVLSVCNGTLLGKNWPQNYTKPVTCANSSCHNTL